MTKAYKIIAEFTDGHRIVLEECYNKNCAIALARIAKIKHAGEANIKIVTAK